MGTRERANTAHTYVHAMGTRERANTAHTYVHAMGTRERANTAHTYVHAMGTHERANTTHTYVHAMGTRERANTAHTYVHAMGTHERANTTHTYLIVGKVSIFDILNKISNMDTFPTITLNATVSVTVSTLPHLYEMPPLWQQWPAAFPIAPLCIPNIPEFKLYPRGGLCFVGSPTLGYYQGADCYYLDDGQ